MTRFCSIIAIVVLTVFSTQAFALDAFAFRKGINLARLHNLPQDDPAKPGAFLWPPFQGAIAQIDDDELARLRVVGFDFIRLPVAPAPFLAVSEKRRKILLDALYDTVKRLQATGFSVLIDVHPDHSDPNWSAEKIRASASGPAFRGYSAFLQNLARFSQRLPAGKVALGLMNEPQQECFLPGPGEWTRLQPLLFKAVRDVAPALPVVLTTGCWSSPEALPHLDMALYDGNTLVDVHYYRPYMFTHQGLPFASGGTRHIAGLEYPGPGADKNLTLFRSLQFIKQREADGVAVPADALSQAKTVVDSYYDDPPQIDRSYIDGHFADIRKWVEQQKIEPHRLIIGEFGVAQQPQGIPAIKGRALWLRHVREVSEMKGFGWALWDYNAGDGYSGFGLVFDNETRKLDPEIVDALGLDAKALNQ